MNTDVNAGVNMGMVMDINTGVGMDTLQRVSGQRPCDREATATLHAQLHPCLDFPPIETTT